MERTVEQSRWGVKSRFDMGETLGFWTEDASGSKSFSTPFENIDFGNRSMIVQKAPKLMRFLSYGLYVAFGAFLFMNMVQIELGPLWFIVSALLVTPLALSQVTSWFDVGVTLLPVANIPGGVLRVVHDGHEEEIIADLAARKRERVRSVFARLDLNRDPAQEVAKFDWLLANGFIDATEHGDSRAKIEAAARLAATQATTLN